MSDEADRAKVFGAGEEGFAMKSLPGDIKTANEGIQKNRDVNVAGTSSNASQGTLGLGDVEQGLGHRGFL